MTIRFKDFAIKEASDEGNGSFTGYAATFDREPDSYGDVIAPGAFDATLKAWRESGKPVPLLYGHNMEDPDYNIGYAELEVDEKGLLARGHFDGSPKAQRVRELVKAGRLYKMSFAYSVKDAGPVELGDGADAFELRELELYEVSVVLVPANQHAEILDAKSLSMLRKYGMTISKATGGAIRAAIESLDNITDQAAEAKAALEALLGDEGGDPPDEPDGSNGDEGGGEEPDGGNQAGKSREEIVARLKNLIE